MISSRGSDELVSFKNSLWRTHREAHLNARQSKAVARMLDLGPEGFEGGISNQKYRNLTKTTRESAKRDLEDLAAKALLVRIGDAGRTVRYAIAWPGDRPQRT